MYKRQEEYEAFNKEFAEWNGARYAVGLATGLDAIYLSLKALQIGPGDEVIIPSKDVYKRQVLLK